MDFSVDFKSIQYATPPIRPTPTTPPQMRIVFDDEYHRVHPHSQSHDLDGSLPAKVYFTLTIIIESCRDTDLGVYDIERYYTII